MIMRDEYPRPSFVRENWQSLNGEWEFYNDLCASGDDRKVYNAERLESTINVPFCPESELSGIHFLDFMPSVWYARNISLKKEQLNGRVLLHIGASDYKTVLYVNAKRVGQHIGGYTSFSFDISEYLKEGENRLVINVLDDLRSGKQPCGKQSRKFYSHTCDYTRTTGIWQTVWLEFVPKIYLKKVDVTATDLNGTVILRPTLSRYVANAYLKTVINFEGKIVSERDFPLSGETSICAVMLSEPKLWNVGEPNLYDIEYTLYVDSQPIDNVKSYFGIRRIDIDGYKVLINGKSVFQRLILDQGFYPDGIYTAPSDEALKRDIELSMNLGFNGARLHQKVFEERYLYHADKAGYLVWGEFPDWGMDITSLDALHEMLPQWLDSIERDYNHPCIIGWCPHNETWDLDRRAQIDSNISVIYKATKRVDPTRPVIDTSGFYHTEKTDIFDVHDYEQEVDVFKAKMQAHAKGKYYIPFPDRQSYDGKSPYMVSEYGGIKWNNKRDDKVSWGYGNGPETADELIARYCGLTQAILSANNICGFCYTQLTDVEQEANGLYYYDRSPKFSEEQYGLIRKTNTLKAAIEE